MAWYGWLALGASLTGFVLTWRRAAWLIAQDLAGQQPDGGEIAMGLLLGFLVAFLWPLIVPLYMLHRRGTLLGIGHALIAPPRHERKRLREEELKKRIRDLERQLRLSER